MLRYAVAVAAISVLAWAGIGHAQSYHTVDTQLDLGARGTQVTYLQQALALDPKIYPEGLVTGYFGPLTQRAVVNFQIAYGLPAVGRVGPMTRAALNGVITRGSVVDSTAPMISGISSSTVSTSARVSWSTSESSKGRVFYSTSPLAMQEAPDSKVEPFIGGDVVSDLSLTSAKSLSISNLLPNRNYYFVIEAIDAENNVSVSSQGIFTTGF